MVCLPLKVTAVRADQAVDGVLHLLSDAHGDEPRLVRLIVRVSHRLLAIERGEVVRARFVT